MKRKNKKCYCTLMSTVWASLQGFMFIKGYVTLNLPNETFNGTRSKH